MKLKYRTSVEIIPSSPFNFDATFYKPDHFTTGDNFWQSGIRWQTWCQDGVSLGLKFENIGSVDKPRIRLDIFSPQKLSEKANGALIKEVYYRYNLGLDLVEFYKMGSLHHGLAQAIKNLYGMRPGHPSSLYEYLIIGVVLQNAAVRRSIAMFRALLENYGTELEFGGKELWCFWTSG